MNARATYCYPHSRLVLLGWVALLVSLFVLSSTAFAAEELPDSSQPSRTQLAGIGPSDPEEVKSFLDGEIPAELSRNQVPGAIVSVVADGRLIFAAGYGSADPSKEVAVQADETLFRIGSLSKLFVWTAVMQLQEQGKLDLHTDVNAYLESLQIPDTYAQPITVANLMTHTAGFEDSVEGVLARDEADVEPLGSWLANHIPDRVRPPGEVTAYSNYGAALAGHVVEQVSGEPWDEYVEKNILAPLDMNRTTFRQPLPDDVAQDLSDGFTYSSESKVEDFAYVQQAPAGSGISRASDMANFAIGHLNEGAFGDGRVLQDATARLMHAQQFTNDAGLPGMTYGLVEQTVNGYRLISHGGDVGGFSSTLLLLPEQDVGVFASYNSAGGNTAREELLQSFMDRYYPAPHPEPAVQPSEGSATRAGKAAGSYWSTRRSHETFEKSFAAINAIQVRQDGNGRLQIDMGEQSGYGKVDLVEIAPWQFEQINGESIGAVVFHTDADGEVSEMLLGNLPIFAYTKMAWYETLRFNLILLGLAGLVFVSALLFWPAHWLWRRLRSHWRSRPQSLEQTPDAGAPRGASFVFWVTLITVALYIVTVLLFILSLSADVYGRPASLDAVFVMVWVALGLAAATVVGVGIAWVRRYWSPLQRIHETVLATAMVAVGWQFIFWKLAVI